MTRDARRELCGAATLDEGTLGERLLADVQTIWRDDEEHLFTTTILERLGEIDEAPWKEGWDTPPRSLSARSLAGLLRPYGVASRTVRIGDDTAKGYARADLADLWRRYVTADTPSQEREASELIRDDGRDGRVTDSDFGGVTPPDHPKQASRDAVTAVTGPRVERGQASANGDGAELAARERELLVAIDPDDRDHGLKVALARAKARRPHQPESATDAIDAVAEIRLALASVKETQP